MQSNNVMVTKALKLWCVKSTIFREAGWSVTLDEPRQRNDNDTTNKGQSPAIQLISRTVTSSIRNRRDHYDQTEDVQNEHHSR